MGDNFSPVIISILHTLICRNNEKIEKKRVERKQILRRKGGIRKKAKKIENNGALVCKLN